MSQLIDEIEDASRGRKVSVAPPEDHEALERHKKETQESFDKVNADRAKVPPK